MNKHLSVDFLSAECTKKALNILADDLSICFDVLADAAKAGNINAAYELGEWSRLLGNDDENTTTAKIK